MASLTVPIVSTPSIHAIPSSAIDDDRMERVLTSWAHVTSTCRSSMRLMMTQPPTSWASKRLLLHCFVRRLNCAACLLIADRKFESAVDDLRATMVSPLVAFYVDMDAWLCIVIINNGLVINGNGYMYDRCPSS